MVYSAKNCGSGSARPCGTRQDRREQQRHQGLRQGGATSSGRALRFEQDRCLEALAVEQQACVHVAQASLAHQRSTVG